MSDIEKLREFLQWPEEVQQLCCELCKLPTKKTIKKTAKRQRSIWSRDDRDVLRTFVLDNTPNGKWHELSEKDRAKIAAELDRTESGCREQYKVVRK